MNTHIITITMKKTIILITILLVLLFMVGCESGPLCSPEGSCSCVVDNWYQCVYTEGTYTLDDTGVACTDTMPCTE